MGKSAPPGATLATKRPVCGPPYGIDDEVEGLPGLLRWRAGVVDDLVRAYPAQEIAVCAGGNGDHRCAAPPRQLQGRVSYAACRAVDHEAGASPQRNGLVKLALDRR